MSVMECAQLDYIHDGLRKDTHGNGSMMGQVCYRKVLAEHLAVQHPVSFAREQ